MARVRETTACDSSKRFSEMTFIRMMTMIIQVIVASGLPPSERKPEVLNQQGVRLIEGNSREVGNDLVALNIWWNLHILRDALRRVSRLIT
jgi:hypothetical protein